MDKYLNYVKTVRIEAIPNCASPRFKYDDENDDNEGDTANVVSALLNRTAIVCSFSASNNQDKTRVCLKCGNQHIV